LSPPSPERMELEAISNFGILNPREAREQKLAEQANP
jgi:hypothetical protein